MGSLKATTGDLPNIERWVWFAVGATCVAMFSSAVLHGALGYDVQMGWVSRLDPRLESTLHAWLGSSLLAGSGVLAGLKAARTRDEGQPLARYWFALSAALIYMSVDESARLHELWLVSLLKRLFGQDTPGELWAVFGLLGVAAVVPLSLGFLRQLEPQLRRCFLLSAVVYLAGAAGFELAYGVYRTQGGTNALLMLLTSSVEETLELVGAALLFCGLFRYLFRATPSNAPA